MLSIIRVYVALILLILSIGAFADDIGYKLLWKTSVSGIDSIIPYKKSDVGFLLVRKATTKDMKTSKPLSNMVLIESKMNQTINLSYFTSPILPATNCGSEARFSDSNAYYVFNNCDFIDGKGYPVLKNTPGGWVWVSLDTFADIDKTDILLYDKEAGKVVDSAGKTFKDEIKKYMIDADIDFLGQYAEKGMTYLTFGIKGTPAAVGNTPTYNNIKMLKCAKDKTPELIEFAKEAFVNNDAKSELNESNTKDSAMQFGPSTFVNGKMYLWCNMNLKGEQPQFFLINYDGKTSSVIVSYTDYRDKIIINKSKEVQKKLSDLSSDGNPIVGVDANKHIIFMMNYKVYTLIN